MNDLSTCDDCTICTGCGRRWCKAWETSPGEVDDLCTECFCTEAPVDPDPFGTWLRGGWSA